MPDHIHKTIEMIVEQVRDFEQKATQKKQMANGLCDLAGIAHIFPDEQMAVGTLGPLTPDAYYGKALASVVREVLERRKRAGLGAATVNEIFDSMKSGGYHFNTKNEDNAKRGLYVSLSKNSVTFHRLPNGTYGLLEWYPNARPTSTSNGKGRDTQEPEQEIAVEETAESLADDESDLLSPKRPR